jgi:hypothetical protein
VIVVLVVLVVLLVSLSQQSEPFEDAPKRKHLRHIYINNTGMGDFIRGSIELAKICKQLNVSFDVDYSQHAIGKWLTNKRMQKDLLPDRDKIIESPLMKLDSPTIKAIIVNELGNVSDGGVVFIGTCHPMITYPIEEDIRQFAKESFEPNEELKKEVDAVLGTLGVKRPYAVIHARLGDHVLTNGVREGEAKYEEIRKKIAEKRSNLPKDTPMVVVSDDARFKKYLHDKDGYFLIPTTPRHTTSGNNMKDTMIDFATLCGASAIIQYSGYYWGSGFSDRAADLYNMPLYKTAK